MLAMGVTWYAAFLLSTTLHEAAHAWLAMKMGDFTAYHGGQVTLNPEPHIRREPIGMVVVPIVAFLFTQGQFMIGWASAPYNVQWANRYPKRSALMALAGPVSNLMLALFSALLIRIGFAVKLFAIPAGGSIKISEVAVAAPGTGEAAAMLAAGLSILFSLNMLLAIFNLLPLPPLDGHSVLTFFMGHETALRYRQFMSSGMIPMIGLIVAWRLLPVIFFPVYVAAVLILRYGV